MSKLSDRLFIGVGGHVVAIDPATGEEIWRTKLKTSSFATVAVTEAGLFGGAGGELFRLDPATGAILWHNKLRGLGMGIVTFPGAGETAGQAAAEAQRRAAAATA